MTTAAQANTANTLLAIARLQQAGQEIESRKMLRDYMNLERQQKIMEGERKGRETAIGTMEQEYTGEAPSPESTQYFAKARAMFQPGATTTRQLETGAPPITTPSGLTIPTSTTLVSATPTRQDIAAEFQRGQEAYRKESLTEAEARGIDKNLPGLYGRIATMQRPPLPSKVGALEKEYQSAEKLRQETRFEAAKAGGEEYETKFKERTLEPRVTTAEQGAKKAIAETAKAERENRIGEIYDMPMKQFDFLIKQGDAFLKSEEVRRSPIVYQKALDDLAHVQAQNRNLGLEFQKNKGILDATDRVLAAKPESDEWYKAADDLATRSGHVINVRDQPRIATEAAARLGERSAAGIAALQQAINEGKDIQTINGLASGVRKTQIAAAEVQRSPTVDITAVVPGGQGWRGQSGATTSRVNVRTNVARMYDDGTLERIASLQQEPPPGWTPGKAAAEMIRIEHGYAGDDSTMYARALANSNYPSVVKDEAREYLQGASETVKPAAPQAQVPTPGKIGSLQIPPEREAEQARKRERVIRALGAQTEDIGGVMP